MSTIKTYTFKITKMEEQWKANVERYDSAQDVVDDCKTRKITDSSFDDQAHRDLDKSWTGVGTYEEALDLLRNGYQPTVEKLKSALNAKRTSTSKRISFHNDIQGFAPVVPLALKGVPNSMVNMTMKPMKAKVIDIYYDIGCSCGTSTNTIIKNGQILLSAIIELERQGYRFNLYAVQTYNSNGGNDSDVLCVKVKDSNRPLDLRRISFPLTHPAFSRVIGFDWYSKMPKARYRSGYGKSLKYAMDEDIDNVMEFAKNIFGDNAVYLSNEIIKEKGEEHIKEVILK